jgi:hypothetical protein
MPFSIINDVREVVTIHFKMDDGNDVFPGALVLLKAEYDALTPAALEALQMAKYGEWVIVRTPKPEPTLEELQAEADRIDAALNAGQERKAFVMVEIARRVNG